MVLPVHPRTTTEWIRQSTRRQSSDAHNGHAGKTSTPSFSFGETIRRSHPAHLNWPMTSSPIENSSWLVVLLTELWTSMGWGAAGLVAVKHLDLRRADARGVGLHQERYRDTNHSDDGEEYETDGQKCPFRQTRREVRCPIGPPGRSGAITRVVEPPLAVGTERRLLEQGNAAPMASRRLGAVMPLAIWFDPHGPAPPDDMTNGV